jgi:predicted nucleic acid-binding protein
MPSILLDTNLLVYLFDPRGPVQREKAKGILLAIENSGLGCLSAQCLAEFFRVATVKLGLPPAEIYPVIERWVSVFPTFAITPQIVLEAGRGVRDYGLSYYDAQIWAAARLSQVTIVFSEDFQDGQTLEGVRFVNPFHPGFHLDEWLSVR